MGRILYIFPHPDDESFGPGPAISKQRRAGHDVHLLTLTRGEATSQREKYGYDKKKMGEVRYREMQRMADALDLTDLEVLDLPDGGLDALNPLDLEKIVSSRIRNVRPHVVVTYPTHGCSGHLDHLVTHAVVKRVFCALKAEGAEYPRRLAFFTLDDAAPIERPEHLRGSPHDQIDCVVPFGGEDRRRGEAALQAYETYRDVVVAHRPLDTVSHGVCFVFFGETYDPPVDDLMDGVS